MLDRIKTGWHLILSLPPSRAARVPPPSSEGGRVTSDFYFHHSRDVCPWRVGLRREQAPALRYVRIFPFFCTAGACVLAELCTGGHGVPPLRLYGFIFITAGTCVCVELCMAGVEARHYAGWHLICLSLRLCVEKFAANPPPSSEGGKVASDFWFYRPNPALNI